MIYSHKISTKISKVFHSFLNSVPSQAIPHINWDGESNYFPFIEMEMTLEYFVSIPNCEHIAHFLAPKVPPPFLMIKSHFILIRY